MNAYLAGITGELAEKLNEGEACPVCGSTSHPHKALKAPDSVAKSDVDRKKNEADAKYNELNAKSADKVGAEKVFKTEASDAINSFNTKKGELGARIKSLSDRLERIKVSNNGLDDKLQEAEADLAFARSLRGDTGIGLQRYVLGILFSSGDAMNVLNSIQEANSLVGIISHVQLLQERISTKIKVVETDTGNHIVQSVG